MTLSGLVDLFCTEPTVSASHRRRARGAPGGPRPDRAAPMRPLIAAALAAAAERGGADRPVLLVTSTFREAEELTGALECLLGAGRRRLLPGLGDPAARAAQPALGHGRPPARRAPPAGRQRRAAAAADHRGPGPQRAAAAGQGPGRPDARSGWPSGRTSTSTSWPRALVDAAYVRVDLVERRGEFAVRGGIVDVFPPTEEHPVRVDFFGDTVEEIRYFSVADQRSSDLTLDRGHRLARAGSCCSPTRSAAGRSRWPSSIPS